MAELDAAETKKRKTEHAEMAEEACLCLVTYEELFVIKLSNLKKQDEVKDWTCLPPPKIEFSMRLPEPDLCPFEFDSKIYMAVSDSPPLNLGKKPGSWRIYEFKFEEGKFEPEESLDGVPAPLFRSYVANTPGSGDVYFYINPVVIDSGFYVLCPDSRVWKQLNPPPDYQTRGSNFAMFVLHNTVFLSSFTGNGTDSYLAHFDHIKETWTVEPDSDNNLSKFINHRYNRGFGTGSCYATYTPQISVPLLGLDSNYTVCLTDDKYVDGPPLNTPLEKVFAILVNHQNGRVALYQYLDLFFEGFQPWMTDRARVNLLDLGNGKVCAILSAELSESESESESLAFCFSIFTLSLLEDFAALQLDSGAPPMERDFLKVTVHRRCVYVMKNWNPANNMRYAFVWPPTKGRRFYHTTE
ncbi:hypothetical protein HN51_006243 [Arachis hypogaea]|nr:uncharacterized protein DS421_14g488320 [Arachis hypogaea]